MRSSDNHQHSMQEFIRMSTRQKKEKKERSGKKADEILKVCTKCGGTWSDISFAGDRHYCFYKKGVLPTYGKERQDCKKCAGV